MTAPVTVPAVVWQPHRPRLRPDPAHPRPWRAPSEFSEGPRRPLSADDKHVWRMRLSILRAMKRITFHHERAGQALLAFIGPDGQLDPSHRAVAREAAIEQRTVRRAFKALHELGMLTWRRRLVRAEGSWRAEQATNAYEILVPVQWALPLPVPERARVRWRRASGGQEVRESRSLYDSPLPPVGPHPPLRSPQEQADYLLREFGPWKGRKRNE